MPFKVTVVEKDVAFYENCQSSSSRKTLSDKSGAVLGATIYSLDETIRIESNRVRIIPEVINI